MSMFSDGLDSDITTERFKSLWAIARLAGTELPKTRLTMLVAEAESSSGKKAGVFVGNIAATIRVCIKNLQGQQAHIDAWRELAKSGLLQLPNK